MSAKTLASAIATRNKKPKIKAKVITTKPVVKAPVAPLISPYDKVRGVKNTTRNESGAVVFKIDCWNRLERFLILGSEGHAYKAGNAVVQESFKALDECIKKDGIATVDTILRISKDGRAAKNLYAVAALAYCASKADASTKGYAMAVLPEVARTGTDLFYFAEVANKLRGWGRLLREGVANWYTRKDPVEELAYQVIKYKQREGWSHRDLLRLSHPKADGKMMNNLFRYIVKGPEGIAAGTDMPEIIVAAEEAKTASPKKLVQLILDHNLPREVIPTHQLNRADVWVALLENMPMTALIRNLGKMSSVGLFMDKDITSDVVNKLTNSNALKKARVHPFKILLALTTYSTGRGVLGDLTWTPNTQIKNALDQAFYESFWYVEPSEVNTMIALDISASMTWSRIQGSHITPRTGSVALAMVTSRVEPNKQVVGFSSGITQIDRLFREDYSLEQTIMAVEQLPASHTDCSLPMRHALANKTGTEVFVIYTDNETNYGGNPAVELDRYRQATGIPAKLIVVGMTATDFSVANPNDPGMLDVVGFDAAAPDIISIFSKNDF